MNNGKITPEAAVAIGDAAEDLWSDFNSAAVAEQMKAEEVSPNSPLSENVVQLTAKARDLHEVGLDAWYWELELNRGQQPSLSYRSRVERSLGLTARDTVDTKIPEPEKVETLLSAEGQAAVNAVERLLELTANMVHTDGTQPVPEDMARRIKEEFERLQKATEIVDAALENSDLEPLDPKKEFYEYVDFRLEKYIQLVGKGVELNPQQLEECLNLALARSGITEFTAQGAKTLYEDLRKAAIYEQFGIGGDQLGQGVDTYVVWANAARTMQYHAENLLYPPTRTNGEQ